MGSHKRDFCIQATLDTNSMQVQIRVIKLDASGCKMISAGVGKVLLPSAPHWGWLAATLCHGFACQTIREAKFHSVLITVMKSIALLFAFAFLRALCLEVAKSTGYRIQSLLLSFLLLAL